MSDPSNTATPEPEPMTMTLGLPRRIVLYYDMLTEAGVYLSTQEALCGAILNSWRFEKASFHSMRVDMDAGEDKPANEVETGQGSDPGVGV